MTIVEVGAGEGCYAAGVSAAASSPRTVGGAMVTTVKSRSVIAVVVPSGSLTEEIWIEIGRAHV